MNKLSALGAAPKIGGIALPWLVLAIFLSIRYKEYFFYFSEMSPILFLSGLTLVLIGLILYFLTAISLIKGLKETRLISNGTYYLCCNPLYTSIILFILPGISLMMNSWLILTTSFLAFAAFKVFIRSEYRELESFFGEAYIQYRSKTPELIPFPIKKWFMAKKYRFPNS